MEPTDEQLNEAAAELCGWGWYVFNERPDRRYWLSPTDDQRRRQIMRPARGDEPAFAQTYFPDYCQDYSLLPELWSVLRKRGLCDSHTYAWCMGEILRRQKPEWKDTHRGDPMLFEIISAPCRWHVEAFLKACNAWPKEWGR